MNNLAKMLRELDLEKNSIEDIRNVLNFIANEIIKKRKDLYELKQYIAVTREYYSDGVDEELQAEITRIIGG